MSNGNLPDQIVLRIRRFAPGRDREPVWKEYKIAYEAGMTVLDALWKVKESSDPTLAWRASCRMGVCGSCGMLINGKAGLGCNTQISELATPVVTVAPLANFPIVRDLVPDLASALRCPYRLVAVHHSLQHQRATRAHPRVPSVGRGDGALPPVFLLHQVRLLHGCLSDVRHRPGVFRSRGPGPGASLQHRQPGRRLRNTQRGAGRGGRTLAMPLRWRVLAGVPERRRSSKGHPVDETTVGRRCTGPEKEAPTCRTGREAGGYRTPPRRPGGSRPHRLNPSCRSQGSRRREAGDPDSVRMRQPDRRSGFLRTPRAD